MKQEFLALQRIYMKSVLRLPIIAFAILAGAASLIAQNQSGNEQGRLTTLGQNYRIGPGDLIDVMVSESPALSRAGIRVNNTGTIQLPMIDSEVIAGCQTERELADKVKEAYKKYLLNPHVTVAVQQFNAAPVALIGAVNAPGRFQLQRPIRVLELLAFANGPAERAGSTIEVIRNTSLPYCDGSMLISPPEAEDQLMSLKLTDTLKGIDASNPYVRAGDIIRVSEADLAKVFVGGNVRAPQALNVKDSVTLSQAIAMAGGLSPDAKPERIKIRRQLTGSVNRAEIIVNLKDIQSQKRDDEILQANDIIEVPGPKPNVFRDFFKMVIPSIAQLPIRVIP